MAVDPSLLGKGVSALSKICGDKDMQKMIFGQYSDGTTRSLFDALDGEVLSPKQKKDKLYKKKKSGKKKIKL